MRAGLLTASLAAALAGCGDEPNLSAANGKGVGDAAAPAANAAAAAPETAATGRQYAALAGAGDRFGIEAARLAREKAQRADVREFAAALLAEHQRSTAGPCPRRRRGAAADPFRAVAQRRAAGESGSAAADRRRRVRSGLAAPAGHRPRAGADPGHRLCRERRIRAAAPPCRRRRRDDPPPSRARPRAGGARAAAAMRQGPSFQRMLESPLPCCIRTR